MNDLTLGDVIAILPTVIDRHAPTDPLYRLLAKVARQIAAGNFGKDSAAAGQMGELGELEFPYFQMGTIDSVNLFALDELIIFAFYWANRHRYRKVLDCGANLGLHSMMLARCGFEVRSFEPDPVHLDQLRGNLARNGIAGVDLHPAGISVASGAVEFVRLLGNTTGSHIAGAKPSPYGEMERITIPVEAAAPHFAWADLVKLDIEGHEAEVLTAIAPHDLGHVDLMVEVGSEANARALFQHFSGGPIRMFAQKRAWAQVVGLDDMPTSHRDGSLFMTAKTAMPWDGAAV